MLNLTMPFRAQLSQTSGPFRALCLLLTLAFLLGGGARGDIQSLMLLRPAAILLLFYGLSRLESAHIRAHRFLFAMALAMLGLIALHLVPLPPAWWSRLPGRDLIVAIDQAVGLGAVWRPMSLAPDATLNALYAATVPFAALVLGAQLAERERQWLIWPVLALGGLSAVLALAQMLGGADTFLRFYKATNEGAAVGLFANRNHQALLLAALLPTIAVWASARSDGTRAAHARFYLALLAGGALLPLVLVTGSRAGLMLAALALLLIAAILVIGNGRGVGHAISARIFALVLIVAGLVTLTLWTGRGTAWDRLFDTSSGDDMRFLIVPTLVPMIADYLPWGSGLGSFAPVYQVHEPDRLLDPTYTNHAHNDWLELALTGGIPALALLAIAIAAYFYTVRGLFLGGAAQSAPLRLARLGSVLVFLLATASLGDYPLRVPSLACLFVVATIWMSCSLPKNQSFGATS